ncbi:MAG: RIP metalloprotease RseP, partial [Flavobacteriales bacterium]|nr:RIP metalloprotease RseP [Flavobacteriales bacterium]
RSKPAWQRLIIMLGGVTVNVILGMLIYMMVLFVWGREYIPTENMTYGVYADSTAQEVGFRNGDKIITVGGEKVKKFSDVQLNIILNDNKEVVVNRDGQNVNIQITNGTIAKILERQKPFLQVAVAPIVEEVVSGSNAEKAGLLKGDRIVEVAGSETNFFRDVVKELKQSKGEKISISVIRNNEALLLNTEVTEEGTLGFQIMAIDEQIEFETEKYTLLESIPGGVNEAYDKFNSYIKQMKLMFKPETGAYKSMGGFITIGKAFSKTWDWERFWNFTAFLSIILAIMNILPIPALDGGHVMFLIYEIVTGRSPHEKVMEYAQIAGIVTLLALMAFANGNDILRLFQ